MGFGFSGGGSGGGGGSGFNELFNSDPLNPEEVLYFIGGGNSSHPYGVWNVRNDWRVFIDKPSEAPDTEQDAMFGPDGKIYHCPDDALFRFDIEGTEYVGDIDISPPGSGSTGYNYGPTLDEDGYMYYGVYDHNDTIYVLRKVHIDSPETIEWESDPINYRGPTLYPGDGVLITHPLSSNDNALFCHSKDDGSLVFSVDDLNTVTNIGTIERKSAYGYPGGGALVAITDYTDSEVIRLDSSGDVVWTSMINNTGRMLSDVLFVEPGGDIIFGHNGGISRIDGSGNETNRVPSGTRVGYFNYIDVGDGYVIGFGISSDILIYDLGNDVLHWKESFDNPPLEEAFHTMNPMQAPSEYF